MNIVFFTLCNYITSEKLIECLFDGITSIISALVVAGVTGVILNKIIIKERKIGRKLLDSGIEKATLGSGGIKKKDWNELFKLAKGKELSDIKLCFITGRGFLVENSGMLFELLGNEKLNISIMLANPAGQYLADEYEKCNSLDSLKKVHNEKIEELVNYYYEISQRPSDAKGFLEREFIMLENKKILNCEEEEAKAAIRAKLEQHGEHVYQVYYVKLKLQSIKRESKGKIRLFYYNDQYRFPFIILNCNEKKESVGYTYAWCNITPPAQEAYDAIRLYCSRDDEEKDNFVSELNDSAEYILNVSKEVDL